MPNAIIANPTNHILSDLSSVTQVFIGWQT